VGRESEDRWPPTVSHLRTPVADLISCCTEEVPYSTVSSIGAGDGHAEDLILVSNPEGAGCKQQPPGRGLFTVHTGLLRTVDSVDNEGVQVQDRREMVYSVQ
jgi:hypothetical protein